MKLMKTFVCGSALFILSACGGIGSSGGSGNSATPVSPEIDFCTTSTAYASQVTVTGTASFYKRGLSVTKSGGAVTEMTLDAPISTALPIKFAEIRVLNSAGTVVQCGKTNSVGALKALDGTSNLSIPNTPGNYTVEVISRSSHTLSVPGGKNPFNYYVSIKKDLYSNEPYRLSQAVTSSGVGSVSTSLTAYARESESSEILGGAFNIYNSLLVSYEYLAQNTGFSNLACMNPKLHVYWKAGFNPAQYLYPSSNPNDVPTVSFYVRSDNQLFINGGVLGNVSSKDTDHFDDTVIIHELGHHVEDVCGKIDSPGGSHYGLYRIDPRFAWSEGWGNFFGAHVVHNNIASLNPDLSAQLSGTRWDQYLDTSGYNEGSTTSGTSLIILNLIKPGSSPEAIATSGGTRWYDKVDSTTYPGEGHTREVSISRSLYKGTNTCTTYCSNSSNFEYYWKAFENDPIGIGMGKMQYPFRSSVRFYNRLFAALPGPSTSAIDNILNTDEAQQRDVSTSYVVSGQRIWPPYAIKLISNGGTPCTNPLQMQPRTEIANLTDGFSDHRYSNHYFVIDMSVLPGVNQITLSATKSTGSDVDIDLILYNDGFRFNQDCTINSSGACSSWAKSTSADMVISDRSVAASPSLPYTKTITGMAGLSTSAFYMLDVRAFTANKIINPSTLYNYTLTTQSGAYLCPSPTY